MTPRQFVTYACTLLSLTQGCCKLGHAESPPAAPSNIAPRGYYVLQSAQTNSKVPDAILSDKRIAGVSLRRNWKECNPSQGKYDFSYFDREIPRIAKAGKEVMLHVDADWDGVPGWLVCERYTFLDKNKSHDTYGKQLSLPVPWDDDFTLHWLRFLHAFGKKYNGHPDVVAVHVGGPTRSGSECSWPPEVKKVRGYSDERLLEVWDVMFAAYSGSFPDTCVVLDLAHPIDGERKMSKPVLDLFFSTVSMPAAQHNSLSAKSSLSYDIHQLIHGLGQRGLPSGFQQLSGSHENRYGGSLQKSLAIASDAKADWIEIYDTDRAKLKAAWLPK
jgi:hypothetical protein